MPPDEMSRLVELETWMRSRGVIHLRTPDGIELHLGPAPSPGAPARARRTPEETAAAKAERDAAIMFAATSIRPRTIGEQLAEKHQRTKAMRT